MEDEGYRHALAAVDRQVCVELLGQQLDQAEAEGFCFYEVEVGGKAAAIIGDRHADIFFRIGMEGYRYQTRAVVGECVFEGIGNGFVEDESERNGLRNIQTDVVDLQVEMDAGGVAERLCQVSGQLFDIFFHIYIGLLFVGLV